MENDYKRMKYHKHLCTFLTTDCHQSSTCTNFGHLQRDPMHDVSMLPPNTKSNLFRDVLSHWPTTSRIMCTLVVKCIDK